LAQDALAYGAACADDIRRPDGTADLSRWPAPFCPRCALPKVSGEICGRCLDKPPHVDAALTVYAYDFPLDKLVQSFKYGHRLALGAHSGRPLVALGATLAADQIIPLPLHEERLRQRGFNQALEFARPLDRAPPADRRDQLPVAYAIHCRRRDSPDASASRTCATPSAAAPICAAGTSYWSMT